MPRSRRSTPKTDAPAIDERKFVTALGRGLEVLRCFNPRDRWLTNGEISVRTGLAKPTVSRIAYTLTRMGFLRDSGASRRYALGAAAVSLGYTALTQLDIRRTARPLLHDLSQRTNASVHFAINDGVYMQIVDTYYNSAVFVVEVGSRVPMATTSLGRAFFCALPGHERERRLEQLREHGPEDFPRTRRRFAEAVKFYEQHGFCIATGEWRRGVNGAAAPLDPGDGTAPMAIGCSGAAFQLGADLLRRDIGPRLVALVTNLSAKLAPQD